MTQVKNIKDLKISLDELYNGNQEVNIHISDNQFNWSLTLKDYRGFDCMIGSWGANSFHRTPRGVNFLPYKSMGALQTAIKSVIKNKVSQDGIITFSLSNK